jgi:hypothetical protein
MELLVRPVVVQDRDLVLVSRQSQQRKQRKQSRQSQQKMPARKVRPWSFAPSHEGEVEDERSS